MAQRLAALIINAGRVIWKSVAEAYQTTILNAKQTSNQQAQQAATETTQSRFSRKMRPEEAYLILNLKKGATVEEINQHYEQLFKANEVSQGGSFYLQSKVYRAHERLVEVMKEQGATGGNADQSSSSTNTSDSTTSQDHQQQPKSGS